jgi:localization factor PodJL
MRSGVRWNLRGVLPEARDTARKAARRSGVSVSEWLNEAIVEQAAEDGVYDNPDDLDNASEDREHELSAITERLAQSIERLDRRLDAIGAQARSSAAPSRPSGPEAFAPQRYWAPPMQWEPPPAPAHYGSPLPVPPQPRSAPPSDDWSREIDSAVAEISARQHALEADPESPPAPARPTFARSEPALLAQWTPPPPPPVDLSGLESKLDEITTQIRTLNRSSTDAALAELRSELREITRMLTEAMPRKAIDALEKEMRRLTERLEQGHQAGAEPGLIGDMARNLLEVRDHLRSLKPAENLAGLAETITALAHKIDSIGKPDHALPDAGNLQQLESAVGTLRGLVSRVASNEALGELASEVKALSDRIEKVAAQAADRTLGPELETQLRAFTRQLQQQNEQNPFDQLHDRIAALASKLEASDARLGHLDTIERELKGLAGHFNELHAGGARDAKAAPAVDVLQRDISRTQDSVEAVHGTVENVVGRLAMIENEIREQSARDLPKSSAAPKPAVPVPAPEAPRAAPKAAPPAVRERAPIDPNLPPDYPLEPGSGAPKARIVTAGERIAASEAALGGSKGAASGATNFIAAARRAAQSAGAQTPQETAEQPATRKSLTERMRHLLGGAALVLLLVGGYYAVPAAFNYTAPMIFNPLGPSIVLSTTATNPLLADKALEPDEDEAEPAVTVPQTPPADPRQTAETNAAPLAPATLAQDVTGAIPNALPRRILNLPDFGPDRGASAKIPVALRDAATGGDAIAAYDIAMRHLEGRGVPASTEEAARWLQQAAKGGLAPAQFRLGSLYEKGQGVKKNLDAARQLYLAAAESGNAKAMHNLAVLYAEGIDGKTDYQTAAIWFLKGAEHGIADSQYNLGILYARGVGVEQNLQDAYKWFALAAAQGDKDSAQKRDDVAARLPGRELEAAKTAVKTFVARPQPEEAVTVKLPEDKPVQPAAPPRPKKPAPASLPAKSNPA